MDEPSERARRSLGFGAAAIGGAFGTALGGWTAYLFIPGRPLLVAAWVAGAMGAGVGVAVGGHAGAGATFLGAAPFWLLPAWLGAIPIWWVGELLSVENTVVGERIFATLSALAGGGLAGFVGRSIGWGTTGAITGIPEDD